MNATRAATIRLRSSFDGAVSLGPRADADAGDPHPPRGGDPRLRARAVLARRRAFEADGRRAATRAASTPAPSRGSTTAEEAEAIVAAVARRSAARSPSSRRPSARSSAPLLYDLTSLQREANTRYGFTARRTLGAAQRCYEEHKALTYPRTSSRYLTSDMVPEIKPIAGHVGERPEYREGAPVRARRSTCCRSAASSTTRRSATTTRSSRPTPTHTLEKMSDDDRRIYDLVARRFLAVFHPDADVREHARRDDGRRAHLPHARQGAGRAGLARRLRRAGRGRRRARRGGRGPRPAAARARAGRGRRHARRRGRWRRRPSRRGATPTRRCSARWRPPASSSTTTSCARR